MPFISPCLPSALALGNDITQLDLSRYNSDIKPPSDSLEGQGCFFVSCHKNWLIGAAGLDAGLATGALCSLPVSGAPAALSERFGPFGWAGGVGEQEDGRGNGGGPGESIAATVEFKGLEFGDNRDTASKNG